MNARDVADKEIAAIWALEAALLDHLIFIVAVFGDRYVCFESDAQELTRYLHKCLSRVGEHEIVVWQAVSDRIIGEYDVQERSKKWQSVSKTSNQQKMFSLYGLSAYFIPS